MRFGVRWSPGQGEMLRAMVLGLIISLIIPGVNGTAVGATGPSFTTFGVSGASYTTPAGINDLGQVAGIYQVGPPQALQNHGFVRDAQGNITTFDVPGGVVGNTFVQAINNPGQIAGTYQDSNFHNQGYVRDVQGGFATFDVPGQGGIFGVRINNLGQIAGWYQDASSPTLLAHGFVRDAQGNITPFDVPGAVSTFPVGINNLGQVAGVYQDSNGDTHGFVRDPQGHITTFDVPGTLSQYPQGINNLGQIVGYFGDGNSHTGVFIATFAADNTSAGSNIAVSPTDTTTGTSPVTLTFHTVTQAGNTTLTTGTAGPTPPAGFQLGQPPTYYNLSTTAAYSGPITLCINYSGVNYTNPSQLLLFHNENGAWVTATTSLDTTHQVICGTVTSLSPFLIVQRAPFAAFSARVEIYAAAGAFGAQSSFTSGSGGTIDPLIQDVTFQLGGYSVTIPAGSFRRHEGDEGKRDFVYEGAIKGVPLGAWIRLLPGGRDSFLIAAAGASNLPTDNPVTLWLIIGSSSGSIQVNAGFGGD